MKINKKHLFITLITILSFNNVYAEGCNGLLTQEAAELIVELVNIVRIAVPILLIILCSTDFVSMVTGQDEKVVKVATGRIIKRFIAAAAFFFVPLIVSFILGIDAVKNSLNLVDDPLCEIDDGSIDDDGYKTEEEIKDEYDVNDNEEANNNSNENNNDTTNNNNSTSNNSNNNNTTNNNKSQSYIESITSNGVLVTIKAKAVNGKIKGYYFSYNTPTKPDKNGGYLETNNTTIQVGRLPGTTYVWVEDDNGKISDYQTITINNSVILNTKSPITKGTPLKTVLQNKGSSYQEFDKLIARSARAAGAYTKEAAATVAVTLVSVLDKQYGVRIPYRGGGKYNFLGINYTWGSSISDPNYPYQGLDCDGFTHWSYYNAGVKINTSVEHNYWYWDRIPFSKEEVEIGDIISQYKPNAHVKIVVGKTDTGVIVAHANGTRNGVWINEHKYSDTKYDYTIIKGSKIASYYEKNTQLGSGF